MSGSGGRGGSGAGSGGSGGTGGIAGTLAPEGSIADGARCRASSECMSGVCVNRRCQVPRCGDDVCNGSEASTTCVADCDSECGDGVANGGEACDDDDAEGGDGCGSDCTVEAGYACDAAAPSVCTQIDACPANPCGQAQRCEDLPPPALGDAAGRTCVEDPECDDGLCSGGETATGCPQDCTQCGDGMCTGDENLTSCVADCKVCDDGTCSVGEDPTSCPDDCAVCPDTLCTAGETPTTCAADCKICPDGLCTGGETNARCPAVCL
jgi:cysteine-rich repeat protein